MQYFINNGTEPTFFGKYVEEGKEEVKEEAEEKFYTEGSEELKQTRMKFALYSIP